MVTQHNSQAVVAWEAACPTKTIATIPCEHIVSSAGVMHCICMHIPLHSNGAIPTTYLQSPNGVELFQSQQSTEIKWLADDDERVASINLEFSPDGGITWSLFLWLLCRPQ